MSTISDGVRWGTSQLSHSSLHNGAAGATATAYSHYEQLSIKCERHNIPVSFRKGTAKGGVSDFKDKSVNVANNLANYIDMDAAGHVKYGLGFIASQVSQVEVERLERLVRDCRLRIRKQK